MCQELRKKEKGKRKKEKGISPFPQWGEGIFLPLTSMEK
jgi:hypothetical protein